MGTRTDRYPFGKFPYGPEEPWPEPLILLAAIAGVTERVRLGTGILISPLRPAVLLAKTAATLDQVSHGRLDLGVGLGWQREEFSAGGVSFKNRRVVFADQLRACVALWTRPGPVSFASETVNFTDIWCEPRPMQAGVSVNSLKEVTKTGFPLVGPFFVTPSIAVVDVLTPSIGCGSHTGTRVATRRRSRSARRCVR